MYEAADRESVGSGRICGRGIVRVAALLFIAVFWLAGCAGAGEARREENGAPGAEAAVGEGSEDAGGSGAGTDQMATTAEDLRALLVDVATARVCEFLEGRLITLSGSTGSEDSSSGGSGPAAGSLLIRSCSATQIDPEHLRVEVTGTGWQWIASSQEQVGATFELDETVSFNVDITFTGTLDIAYDRQDSILTLWLVPTQPVAAEFDVTEEVQVATEGLWSSIVGTAATVIGGSPEQRAESTIQERGSRKIESRLDRGMTVVLDLCTGRQFVTFGSLPEGRFPASADPDAPAPLSGGRARLYPDGMLMFGPFTTSSTVIARIDELSGGGVHASLICEEDAHALVDAFSAGEKLPDVPHLGEETVRLEGTGRRLGVAANTDCPVVLVIRPLEEQDEPIDFRYTVYREGGEGPQPFAPCGK